MPYSWTTPDIGFATADVLTAEDVNTINGNIGYLDNVVEPSLTNKSGGSVVAGDVLIYDTSNDSSFTTTTTEGDRKAIAVAVETIANNAAGRCNTTGVVTVNVQGNVTRGNYLKTSTTAKRAKDAGAVVNAGCFAVALSSYSGGGAGTVTAKLIPMIHTPRTEYKTASVSTGGAGNGSATFTWDTAFATLTGAVCCTGQNIAGYPAIYGLSVTGGTVEIRGGPADDAVTVNILGVGY